LRRWSRRSEAGANEYSGQGPGKGSEFVVCLPLTHLAHADQPASAALRLLRVDDSVDAAVGMPPVLESDGHDVRVAHEAVTALELAEEFVLKIVLLDLGLPGMDGFQLALELRERAATVNALLIASRFPVGQRQAHNACWAARGAGAHGRPHACPY
jgi:CheY-like chemotaxis protein